MCRARVSGVVLTSSPCATQDASQGEQARTEQHDAAGLRNRASAVDCEGFPLHPLAETTVAYRSTTLRERASGRTSAFVPCVELGTRTVIGASESEIVRRPGCQESRETVYMGSVNVVAECVATEEG